MWKTAFVTHVPLEPDFSLPVYTTATRHVHVCCISWMWCIAELVLRHVSVCDVAALYGVISKSGIE